uniref:arginine repressor n=1 Tax=Tetragenococcus halophilus TaxID=51669 RepID=UPI0024E08F2B|nr:ArgR family transcriptional regulator [Tetragenococcus halophilus]
MKKLHKNERQRLIKQLISQNTIRTQEELLQRLQKKDITIAQATVSRDIRDLKIIKTIDEDGKPKFVLYDTSSLKKQGEKEKLISIFNDIVTKIEHVQFLTIVHTLPDNASLLASMIDEIHLPEVKCSLAGFDTVVLIVADEVHAIEVENYFNEIWQKQTNEQIEN